jgi:carbohydrate-selective porin OprB
VPEDTLLSSLGSAWASLGGLRPAFAKGGVAIGGNYFGEAFVNSGGIHQGGKYDGVLELYMDIEMHKLGFWKGLCFHTNGYQIHGQSITASNIGSLMTVSNLEATPATRLDELWLEQHLFNDHLAVKVGQIAADTEFTVNGHTLFLHDGRARNLTEAILWHGGEGQASRDRFAKLSKEDRERLITFVNSL